MSGMLSILRRDLSRLKFLAVVITVVALLEAFALVFLFTAFMADQRTIDLMSENIRLRGEISSLQVRYNEQTRQLCSVQLRMGDGYRRVLLNLVDRFGLSKRRPKTVTNALLDEFENLGVPIGMGGP